ncbi:MAG: hypothetical protein C4524_01815 [Candidatus Zixiibacteriota bacterium]|nr:MAG: hypothetical protein C4524_01815 [candidate division Zixibacteria bacterium]
MRTAHLKLILGALVLASLAATAAAADEPETNLPKLKQATFVESYSPTEWTVRAAGLGSGRGGKKQEMAALEDARKSAVYFVLYMGTDPLLSTDDERRRFDDVAESFFEINNVMKYLAWESEEYSQRVKTADGKQTRIEKSFRINVGLLREDLISRGVLMATADLTAELGNPQLLVIPEVPRGGNPLEEMEQRPEVKQAARAIESYLTARRYEVIVPEQQDFLNNYGETMQMISSSDEDLAYRIALAVGSDVYITYTVDLERRYQGSSEVKKAMVTVRAFETTTARLLGTETGYSFERPSADEVVTEEAIHDAIDKVLARINAYWKEDLQRGVQYKVVFTITGKFDRRQIEAIQDALADVIAGVSNRNKENVATDQTVDYLIWAKPDKYTQARDLYRDLRDEFGAEVSNAALERRQLNRKLLLLQVANK